MFREYDKRYPNWRASRRKLEETFVREMWRDYWEGKLDRRIAEAFDLDGAIRRAAYEKAVGVVAQADREFEGNEAARKRKCGEAA